MENPYSELEQLLADMKEDFTKFFEKGNQVAGTRVRAKMLSLAQKAKEVRKQVQEIKNSAKSK
jgi:deoxyadenosine/deoxycytidine kinase